MGPLGMAGGMKPTGGRGGRDEGYAVGEGSLQGAVAAALENRGCSVQSQHAVSEPVGSAWACSAHATVAVWGRRLHLAESARVQCEVP